MGRRVGLDLGQVVDAAEEIADARGYEEVTLSAVADRLDVRSPSLYHHVHGLPDLRRHLARRAGERLAEALREAGRDRSGGEALAAMAHAYRAFARGHPGLHGALVLNPEASGESGVWEPITAALEQVGTTDPLRGEMLLILRSFLIGFAILEATEPGEGRARDAAFRNGLEALLGAVRESV